MHPLGPTYWDPSWSCDTGAKDRLRQQHGAELNSARDPEVDWPGQASFVPLVKIMAISYCPLYHCSRISLLLASYLPASLLERNL